VLNNNEHGKQTEISIFPHHHQLTFLNSIPKLVEVEVERLTFEGNKTAGA